MTLILSRTTYSLSTNISCCNQYLVVKLEVYHHSISFWIKCSRKGICDNMSYMPQSRPRKVNHQPPKTKQCSWQRAGLKYWNGPTAKTQEVLVNQGVLFISRLSSLLNLRRIDHFGPLQLRYDVKMMVIAVKPPLVGPSYQSFMEVTQKSMQLWMKRPRWSFAKGELTWLEANLLRNLQERKHITSNVCNVRDRLQEHPIIIFVTNINHKWRLTGCDDHHHQTSLPWFGSSRWIWQDFVMWWTWLNDIALKVWSMSLGIAARGSMKWHKGSADNQEVFYLWQGILMK